MPSYNEMPDESLMDFIGAGEDKAFEALVSRYHQRFFHMAYRWVLNAQDAEDIVQQAFLKLWSGKARWKKGKGAKFTTWFYTILYHQAMDLLRARKQPHALLKEDLAASDDNQERDLAAAQQQRQVFESLQQLPENQRIAIQLFYFEGLKQKEIAKIMGLNVKALESQITRAKQNLRASLTNPFMDEAFYATL